MSLIKPGSRRIRGYILILLVAVGGMMAVLYIAGTVLSAPCQTAIGMPPAHANIESVTIQARRGNTLAGWFMPGKPGQGAILLLHGVRSNRTQMLGRALFLNEAGYAVLAIDFQAHGESPGERITFGYLEAHDVEAAYAYLREHLSAEPIGVIGVSLGGAAALLSSVSDEFDALVLEAVYPTIEEAIGNRLALRLGAIGRYLTPLLTMQMPFRLGFSAEMLRPIDKLSEIQVPLLIIAGADDQHTLPSEAKRMYDKANQAKALWIIEGVAHEDFHAYTLLRYKQRVLNFFQQNLNKTQGN